MTDHPSPASARLATAWLAAALLLLPWAYRIAWDAPRAAVLLLLAPALWLGRAQVTQAMADLFAGRATRTGFAVLLVGLVAASVALSRHWAASLVTAATWCLLALTAILVTRLVRDWGEASRWLLAAMTASGAFATAAHWARWHAGELPHSAFYLHHRLMGLHTFGGAFAGIAVVLLARRLPAVWRVALTLAAILCWAGLLWTGSRSPLIGLAVGLAAWLVKIARPMRASVLLATAGLGLSGMLVSLMMWSDLPYLGWWNLWKRTAVTQSASELTSHRSDFWSEAGTHVRSAPWLGHGPDAYGFLTPQLEGVQPHNLPLQLALDVGLPATLLVFAVLLACLWRGWRRPAHDVTDPAWFALALGYGAATQLDGYFYYPLASIPAMIALGACAGSAGPQRSANAPARPAGLPAQAWRPLALASAAVVLFHCVLYHRILHDGVPASPEALTARLWRAFPSTTYNVDEWIDRWAATGRAQEALATSRHALPHSQTPELFRVKTALLLARRGELPPAIAELELARRESRPEQHAAIDALLERMRSGGVGAR